MVLSTTLSIAIIILLSKLKEVHARELHTKTLYVEIGQKISIFQFIKAILCHYDICQSLHNFPPRTFIPEKHTTRGNTVAERTLKSHLITSSRDKPSGGSQSSPDQQVSPNLKVTSCQIPPPGRVCNVPVAI